MNCTKHQILYILIILGLALGFGYFLNSVRDSKISTQNTIDSLQKEIDSSHVQILELNQNLHYYYDQELVLNGKVDSLKKELIKTKKKLNEEINSVDIYTDDELQLFFNKRYSGFSRSTSR